MIHLGVGVPGIQSLQKVSSYQNEKEITFYQPKNGFYEASMFVSTFLQTFQESQPASINERK